MAGHWPQHLPSITSGETEDSGLQELPCGQGRDRFKSFIKSKDTQRLWTTKTLLILHIEFKCSFTKVASWILS